MSKWFKRQRQNWIAERKEPFNRKDLMQCFDVSVTQASKDLSEYQEKHELIYDPRKKIYIKPQDTNKGTSMVAENKEVPSPWCSDLSKAPKDQFFLVWYKYPCNNGTFADCYTVGQYYLNCDEIALQSNNNDLKYFHAWCLVPHSPKYERFVR